MPLLQDVVRVAAKDDRIDRIAAEFDETTLTGEDFIAWRNEVRPAPTVTGHNYLRRNTGEHKLTGLGFNAETKAEQESTPTPGAAHADAEEASNEEEVDNDDSVEMFHT